MLNYLASKGIGTRPLFYPMNLQPVLKKYGINQDGLEVSKSLYDNGFYIPSGLSLSYEEQKYVVDSLLAYTQ